MNEFDVKTDVLDTYGLQMTASSRSMNTMRYEMSQIRYSLFGLTMIPVRAYMLKKGVEMFNESRRLNNFGNTLIDISKKYLYAENQILTFSGALSNPAFDRNGQYGGHQGSPMNHWEDMAAIVRRYYPNYSDRQIQDLLSRLNGEGCGYVAMINTLFLRFKGREDEFERIFGFPMYVNGELNYDALVTDFYCAEDDPNSSGTDRADRERMFEEYCNERGIPVNVHNVEVTPENYNELVQNGEIVVRIRPLLMRDANGNLNGRNGGHAMTVTGVAEDGRLIVSSWGETYYIEPNWSDFEYIEFQQVTYQ
ncbi:MAG: hypothetical protein K6G61_09905 [Solobacterium sp.]|nr:hypothetical protein [Solobacterium sp.]